MKIAHCIYSLNTGGAETMLIDLVNEQVLQHQVILVIVNKSYEENLLRQVNPLVNIVKLDRKPGSKNPWYIIRLNYLLHSLSLDVVHLHSDSLINLLYGFQNKTFYTCHSLSIDFNPHKVRCVFAISQAVAKDITERYNCSNVEVVLNAIKTNTVKIKEDFSVKSEEQPFRVVQVARLHHLTKGQDILIKAISILRERRGCNIELDFIGCGDSMLFLEQLVEELGLSSCVQFLGKKDRKYIYQHLCSYDLLCNPARLEGFGLIVAEAMAANLPVLVSAYGGAYEIIEEGKYGYAFEYDNPQSCADKLYDIMHNYEAACSKAWDARKHTLEHYSIERMASEYISIYEKNINAMF